VVQFVKAPRYKLEGRGFISRWCHWNFSLTHSFRPHYGPGVATASNRNEYQEYFVGGKGGRYVGLTNLPHSCADCLEIWETQPPGTLRACPGLSRDCFTFIPLHRHNYLRMFWNKPNCLMLLEERNIGNAASEYEGWNFNSGNYLFTTDTK